MNIVLGSAFRNSSLQAVTQYMDQAAGLQELLVEQGHSLRVRAVEGDSTNETQRYIRSRADSRGVDLDLHVHNHGGPHYGSTEQPERMTALSGVGNAILEGVRESDQALVYVESDLVWQPMTMIRLLRQLGAGVDIVSPLTMAGDAFYDIWAFRVNGTRFGPLPPFYSRLRLDALTPVDSVGSCLVMKGAVARSVRMTNGALVEFCANARAQGHKIYCDARERIQHP